MGEGEGEGSRRERAVLRRMGAPGSVGFSECMGTIWAGGVMSLSSSPSSPSGSASRPAGKLTDSCCWRGAGGAGGAVLCSGGSSPGVGGVGGTHSSWLPSSLGLPALCSAAAVLSSTCVPSLSPACARSRCPIATSGEALRLLLALALREPGRPCCAPAAAPLRANGLAGRALGSAAGWAGWVAALLALVGRAQGLRAGALPRAGCTAGGGCLARVAEELRLSAASRSSSSV